MFALRRYVLGGKEKGVEERGGSTGKQYDLSQVLLNREDMKKAVDQC